MLTYSSQIGGLALSLGKKQITTQPQHLIPVSGLDMMSPLCLNDQ